MLGRLEIMPELPSDSRFDLKRIAIVVVTLALTWLVLEVVDVPMWALATFVVVGGVAILGVALLLATSQDLHLEDQVLVWTRPGAAKIKLPVAGLVSIEDRRLATPKAPQLRIRGRGGVEIIVDSTALDRRQIAIVLARLREMRPDLTVPDLLSDV